MSDDDNDKTKVGSKRKPKNIIDLVDEEPPSWFTKFINDNRYLRSSETQSPICDDKSDEKSDDCIEIDDDDDDYEDYFEEDTTQIKETIYKHILDELTQTQRSALKNRIKTGLDKSFEQLHDIIEESMYPIIDTRPTSNLWKLGFGSKEIKKYEKQLLEIRQYVKQRRITLQRILDAKIDIEKKRELVSTYDILQNMSPYSNEYNDLTRKINKILDDSTKINLSDKLEKTDEKLRALIGTRNSLKVRILEAPIPDERKAVIYEKYLLLQKMRDDSSTAANIEEWIEEALKTPWTKIQRNIFDEGDSGECLVKLAEGFKSSISELDAVLETLLLFFNNRLHNPNSKSMMIGLLGSPGTGKTYIGQVIAKVWNMPFNQISLGGVVDSSILDGQHQGWVGSAPGRFVKALQQMGALNGVLFLDEIDKLGTTEHGLQVQYSLLHSTDPIQNAHYHDHYLGPNLPVDLSKMLIICALNTTEGVDPALLSRMRIIKVPDYTNQQKITILRNHLYPDALVNAGLTTDDIELTPDAYVTILNMVEKHVGKEGGVRGIKSCIQTIIDKLGILLRITAEQQEKLHLSFTIKNTERPIKITPDIVTKLYPIEEKSFNPLYI